MVRNIDRMPVPEQPQKPRTPRQERDEAVRRRAEILHVATEEGGDLSEIIPETSKNLVVNETPRNPARRDKEFLAEAKAAGVRLSDYEDKTSKKLVTEAGDPWGRGVTVDEKSQRYAEQSRAYLKGAKEAGVHTEEMDPTQGQKFTQDFGRAEHDTIADRRRQRGKRDLDFIQAARELHDEGKIDRGTLDPTTGQIFTDDSQQIERARRKQGERSHFIGDPTAGKVYTEDKGQRRNQETKNYDVSSYGDTAARIERAKNARYKMEEVDEETPLVLSPEARAAKTTAAKLPDEYDSSYEFMAADNRPSESMTLSAEQRREALERARFNEAAERGENEEEILRLAEDIHARVRRERAAREARLLGDGPDQRKTV